MNRSASCVCVCLRRKLDPSIIIQSTTSPSILQLLAQYSKVNEGWIISRDLSSLIFFLFFQFTEEMRSRSVECDLWLIERKRERESSIHTKRQWKAKWLVYSFAAMALCLRARACVYLYLCAWSKSTCDCENSYLTWEAKFFSAHFVHIKCVYQLCIWIRRRHQSSQGMWNAISTPSVVHHRPTADDRTDRPNYDLLVLQLCPACY